MVILLAGTYGLFRTGSLSVQLAIDLMALGSLASGTWLIWRLQRLDGASKRSALPQRVLRNHWDYGPWALAINVMSWLPGNVVYMALPVSGGLSSVAALRAMMNVLPPSQHVIGALSGLLLSLFAKYRDSDYFSRLIASLLVCFGAITVAAWVVTSLIAEPLIAR